MIGHYKTLHCTYTLRQLLQKIALSKQYSKPRKLIIEYTSCSTFDSRRVILVRIEIEIIVNDKSILHSEYLIKRLKRHMVPPLSNL